MTNISEAAAALLFVAAVWAALWLGPWLLVEVLP